MESTENKNCKKSDESPIKLLLESRSPNGLPNTSADIPQNTNTKTSLKKRLSPLRYPGGKSRVIDQIYANLNAQSLNHFVELFAGGASVGLSLLEAGKIHHLHLNELDPMVHNFWDVVLEQPEELNERICNSLPTMHDYKIAKARTYNAQDKIGDCDVIAAYDYLLLNRTSFGGIMMANSMGGKNGTDEKFRQRWNPTTLTKRISKIAEMRDRITLTRQDAVQFLKENGHLYGTDTTIFIDPPYVMAGKKLYPNAFEGRHQELAAAINEMFDNQARPQIVITYDDCALIRDLYSNADVQQLKVSWSIYRTTDKKI